MRNQQWNQGSFGAFAAMDAAHSKVVWCPGSKSGVWWKRNNPKLSYIMDLKKKGLCTKQLGIILWFLLLNLPIDRSGIISTCLLNDPQFTIARTLRCVKISKLELLANLLCSLQLCRLNPWLGRSATLHLKQHDLASRVLALACPKNWIIDARSRQNGSLPHQL